MASFIIPPDPIEELKNEIGVDSKCYGSYVLSSLDVALHSPRIPINCYSEFSIGDEIYVDTNIDNLFFTKCGGRKIVGVIVSYYDAEMSIKGYKVLYLNQLDFEALDYNTDGNPTGKTIYAKKEGQTEVFDTIRNCATVREAWNAISGKYLKIVDVYETAGGWYTSDPTRPFLPHSRLKGPEFRQRYPLTRKVPVFSFVEKSFVFESDYSYRYFYKDYRIFCDNISHKWGIRNEKTIKIVVKPIFDDIRWGENSFGYGPDMIISSYDKENYSNPVEYVRFYKNGKKAMCKIEDIEEL